MMAAEAPITASNPIISLTAFGIMPIPLSVYDLRLLIHMHAQKKFRICIVELHAHHIETTADADNTSIR